MNRRDFVRCLGLGASASILTGSLHAQKTMHRLAFVHSGIPVDKLTEAGGPFWIRKVYQTLRELGDIEGQKLVVERFSANGRSERFASLAAEVVSRNPDVIIVNFNDLAKQFTIATSNIPLVVITGDPIAAGLLSNLAHPGGNLTGVSINAGLEIYGKRLEIIKEARPKTSKVAALFSGALSGMSDYEDAARRLGIELVAKKLDDVSDAQLSQTFAEIAAQQFDAVIVDEGGSFLAKRALMAALAGQHHLLVLYPYRDYVDEGGPLAYAPDLGELARRMANDVHQIFNGTKAGDLPFYLPNKFQLIVNAKAVQALDLSPTFLARADEVIE